MSESSDQTVKIRIFAGQNLLQGRFFSRWKKNNLRVIPVTYMKSDERD